MCLLLTGGLIAQSPLPDPTHPGKEDPFRNPGKLTLFADDELFSFSPDNPNELVQRLYRTDKDPNLSLKNVTNLGSVPENPVVAASGRILDPAHAAVAFAQRSLGTSILAVHVPNSSPFPVTSALADRNPQTYSTDNMSIAVGDLDKVVDNNFNYRDEIAVAYATKAGRYVLSVLNYTNQSPQIATIDVAADDSINLTQCDSPIGVAIGDFDGDGNNEIAVAIAHQQPRGDTGAPYGPSVGISIFTYVPDGQGGGSLAAKSTYRLGLPQANILASTMSIKAADLNGNGTAELVIGYVLIVAHSSQTYYYPRLTVFRFDKELQPTRAVTVNPFHPSYPLLSSSFPVRVQVVTGQFLYNPSANPPIPFGQQQIAVAWNDGGRSAVDIQAYSVSADLTKMTQIGGTIYAQTDPAWPGTPSQQFSLAAGGFTGNADTKHPTASLAVSAWTARDTATAVYWIRTIAVGPNGLSFKDLQYFNTGTFDVTRRAPLVAVDWDGNSLYLGAPAHLIINGLVSTDYILEEPPKHSYWDGSQVANVTNYANNSVSFSYTTGQENSSKSTDQITAMVGSSSAISAGGSVSAGGGLGIADISAEISYDVTNRASYEYDRAESSYNSDYKERTFTITSETSLDDYLFGRFQTFDIWRYRAYRVGQSSSDPNAFYDFIFPGPTKPFDGGGLDFDWYQPIHENGNILTYPQQFNSSGGNPPDLGSFTDSDGKSKTEPLVPVSQWSFGGTSGTQKLELNAVGGSGGSIDYTHKLSASKDVKYAAKAEVQFKGPFSVGAEVHGAAAFDTSNNNSWGNAITNDSTTTTQTSVTLNKLASNPNQAYSFQPIIYTTQDGTFKMSFAVPNPASSDNNTRGASFWASKYGAKPDPALNLPSRFSPIIDNSGSPDGWQPNTISNRKRMRGLFFRNAMLNPVTNDYDYLRNAAVNGDQVRIEARVYNESTAQDANNITVRFQKIAYDSLTDNEICNAPINAGITGGQICPASARTDIGQTVINHLSPLQFTCLTGTDDPATTGCLNNPVFINWNTKDDTQPVGANEYRIYVVLVPGDSDELYGSDGTPMSISSITSNVSPIVVTTAVPHGLHTGDYVTVGAPGLKFSLSTHNIFQVTYMSDTSFALNGTTDVPGQYSGGGTVTPMNPGENNEGYGRFDVQQSANVPAGTATIKDFLAPDSLQVLDYKTEKLVSVDNVSQGGLTLPLNRPTRVRVGVFSSAAHPEGNTVLLFEGNPEEGASAVGSQLVHPGDNGGQGAYVWFDWTPHTPGLHSLYAKLLDSSRDAKGGSNVSSLPVRVQ